MFAFVFPKLVNVINSSCLVFDLMGVPSCGLRNTQRGKRQVFVCSCIHGNVSRHQELVFAKLTNVIISSCLVFNFVRIASCGPTNMQCTKRQVFVYSCIREVTEHGNLLRHLVFVLVFPKLINMIPSSCRV